MTSAVSAASFQGSDVDGLQKVAQDCTAAAQVVDEVKIVCEAIVAAASIFGPFGAAFISYLKTVVIPWLTKIEEALKLFAQVLSARAQAQTSASSSATSLPTYTTPSNLPTASTSNYPTMPLSAGATSGAGAGGAVTPTTSSSTGAATAPDVQKITALTGLVAAVDHLLHPTSSSGTSGLTPTDPSGSAGTSTAGMLGGSLTPTPGGTGLSDGNALGMLQVPVQILPDGTITPLYHAGDTGSLPGAGGTASITPSTSTEHAMPAASTPASVVAEHLMPQAISHTPATLGGHAADLSGGGGMSGGGMSGGGGSVGSTQPSPIGMPAGALHDTSVNVHPAAATHAVGAHPAPAHAGVTQSGATHGASTNHDGLYSGLGQAAGLGAGAGAIAKASLSEARERAENTTIGAGFLPFDSGSDAGAQADVFSSVLSR